VVVTKEYMRTLKYVLVFVCGFFSHIALNAQEETGYEMKGNNEYVEIDILSSYYNQDGDNAAVTGGKGTEELTDVSTLFVLNIPYSKTKSLLLSAGVDYYTSASTDNIDTNMSSASSEDVRAYINATYSTKNLKKARTFGVSLNGSSEYDYKSLGGGLNFAKEFNEGNSELSVNALAFFDSWELFFPIELRATATVPTTDRRSYTLRTSFAQVINQRLQIAMSAEMIRMEGLLSTPFHRVFFSDSVIPDIERLPDARLKIPLGLRATYYLTEKLVLRSYYRFYTDDFGINAHTLSLEAPIKLSDVFTITPFYRFHTQSAADYFAPFSEHQSTEEFYTSDYDLSELSSNKYGLGLSYAPIYGLTRTKIFSNVLLLNSIALRGSIYNRNTDLNAYSIAFELNFRY